MYRLATVLHVWQSRVHNDPSRYIERNKGRYRIRYINSATATVPATLHSKLRPIKIRTTANLNPHFAPRVMIIL